MQCCNCRFENMPGVAHCGRCGASLRLATAVIDVHPPRAGALRKRLQGALPGRRAAGRLSNAVRDLMRGVWNRVELPHSLLWPLPWILIPGWPQWSIGQRARGTLFLTVWLLCNLCGLLFFGGPLGNLLLGLGLACHAGSIIDLAFTSVAGGLARTGVIVGGMAITGLLVYRPAAWGIGQIVQPVVITAAAPPFLEPNDVFLYRPAADLPVMPTPGTVVLYNLSRADVASRTGGNQLRFTLEGMRIERVLATAGQKAAFAGGRLTVDGQPSPWLPLNPGRLPDNLTFELTIPARCCLILPTTSPQPELRGRWRQAGQIPEDPIWDAPAALPANSGRGGATTDARPFWERMSVVRVDAVIGSVFLRSQPLSRFERIR